MNTTAIGTVVGQMSPHDLQETNERRFVRKHINGYIDKAIREHPESEAKVHAGVALLNKWLEYWMAPWDINTCPSEKHYISKHRRLSQLMAMDKEELVRSIYVAIAYCFEGTLFVSVTAQLASKLDFDDHKDSIQTIAEMVTVVCAADAYDIVRLGTHQSASLGIVNRIPLPRTLLDAMARSMYMPPMVCEPQEIRSNFESPYLTFNECQILKKANAHSGDICLDTLNTQNQVPLKLALDFISSVEEEPSYPLSTMEQIQNWRTFKQHSYALYDLLAKQGNRFWLTHKVDKRGRMYASGYHINTQGSAFKKASTELHHGELVQGVP